jgi:hypothetical protein
MLQNEHKIGIHLVFVLVAWSVDDGQSPCCTGLCDTHSCCVKVHNSRPFQMAPVYVHLQYVEYSMAFSGQDCNLGSVVAFGQHAT